MDYNVVKQLAKNIKEETNLKDYFTKLANDGVVSYDRTASNEIYYRKGTEKVGSVAVNESKNVWKNFADDGIGGDIFKAVEYFEGIKGFVNQVKHLSKNSLEYKNIKNTASNIQVKEKKELEILKDLPNIKHPALIQYLHFRGLNVNAVRGVLHEVHWSAKDKKGNVSNYFALGLPQPDKEGYSLRNKHFKGNIGNIKPVLLKIGNEPIKFKTFEGVFDFLSYRIMNQKEEYNAIILNSNENKKYLHKLDFSNTTNELYLDNDKAGVKASNMIMDITSSNILKEKLTGKEFKIEGVDIDKNLVSIKNMNSNSSENISFTELKKAYKDELYNITRNSTIIDKSSLYKGYDDLNEFLVKDYLQKKNEVSLEPQGITR